MNISIIGSKGYPYVYGGYETFVKHLAERLVTKNCNVTVYCHSNLFKKRIKKVNGINLIYIPSLKSKYFAQPIHSFFSIFHSCYKKSDVILVVNSANGPFGIICKIFNVKTVINVDGMEWLRPKWKGLGSLYYRFSSKLSTLFFDKIVTDSVEMSKVYKNIYSAESETIAYGEEITKSINSELISKWLLKKNEYYLVVGRLIPDNNANLIINQFLKTKSQKKMVIVGDVFYKDNYAESLKNINDPRLLFVGYVYDIYLLNELYCNCYAYIHGHEYGGTNPTMLKAMATGCAIIALDTRFNREMLNNKYGVFFDKNKITLKSKIEFFEKNINFVYELRKKSINGITKTYNWDHITERYLLIFKKLVAQNEIS